MRLIVLFLFTLVLIIFVWQNSAPISIKFLNWQNDNLPPSVLILVAILVGILIATVSNIGNQLRLSKLLKNKSKELESIKSSKEPTK